MSSLPQSDQLRADDLAGLFGALERWEAATFRPLEWNLKFLPHYFGRFPPADFHHDFDTDLHDLHLRRGSRLSYIAPRGGAKSTFVTLGYVLRAALEGWEPYTLILSDSSTQADELLRHIRSELENNPHIAEVYPDVVGQGPEWAGGRIRLRNGVLVSAFGSGKKVRGRRNRSERPSLIVFDDIQSNEDITSPTLRDTAWTWATREVIPAGDERTNFISVGSALHDDAVSVKLGALAGWTGKTFKAVHQWPDKMELWAEFERLATNIADPNRVQTARDFVAANYEEMHRGAKVYWPGRFDLTAMMLKRAEVGVSAFEAEYQGVPGAGIPTEFPADWFEGEDLWFDQWPDDLILKVISLDPSKGTDGGGTDFQAQVSIGVSLADNRFGLYVDASMEREGITAMCDRLASQCRSFGERGRNVDSVICEDNATMGLLPAALDAASVRNSFMIPYLCRPSTGAKEFRILHQLQEPLRRRQIKFRRTPGSRILVSQIKTWPFDSHDDGPDALSTGLNRVRELLHALGMI